MFTRNVSLPILIHRIERVLPSIPWLSRMFFADTVERKVLCTRPGIDYLSKPYRLFFLRYRYRAPLSFDNPSLPHTRKKPVRQGRHDTHLTHRSDHDLDRLQLYILTCRPAAINTACCAASVHIVQIQSRKTCARSCRLRGSHPAT